MEPMEPLRIETDEEYQETIKKLREMCDKANSELSQEDFQKILYDALKKRKQESTP